MRRHRISTQREVPPVTSHLKPGDAFVAICDWNGKVKWISSAETRARLGEDSWANLIPADAERMKVAVARAVALNEKHMLEVTTDIDNRYRVWLWPIGNPDLAVCAFCLLIPPQIGRLATRERQFLRLLAQGLSMKEIASDMDVSVNTVHTHMRNVRDKLALESPNEVVAFAARFFHASGDRSFRETLGAEAEPIDGKTVATGKKLATTSKGESSLPRPAPKKRRLAPHK